MTKPMRIMGAAKLDAFVKRADAPTAAMAEAWRSEVAAASWRSRTGVAARNPTAEHIPPDLVRFWLDGQHCASVRVNYDLGLVLITSFARRRVAGSRRPRMPDVGAS